MNPLLISTFFIILTAVLASMFRMTVKKCLGDGIVKQMLLEFIATAELCAICFELVIGRLMHESVNNQKSKLILFLPVADNYGVWVYALYLFLLTLWWARVWEIESACPYSEMEKVVEGTQEALKALYVIIAQILGGILIYYYVQLLWSMELTETHRGKVDEECKADLQVIILCFEGFPPFYLILLYLNPFLSTTGCNVP